MTLYCIYSKLPVTFMSIIHIDGFLLSQTTDDERFRSRCVLKSSAHKPRAASNSVKNAVVVY